MYAKVLNLSSCPSDYVLVNVGLPPLDMPPETIVYVVRPTTTCVSAGEFRGNLRVGDGVVIERSADNYVIPGKN